MRDRETTPAVPRAPCARPTTNRIRRARRRRRSRSARDASVVPSDQMSELREAAPPRSTFGSMYSTAPTGPRPVIEIPGVIACASPRSDSFAPSSNRRMLAGFTPRWTTPASWRSWAARAAWLTARQRVGPTQGAGGGCQRTAGRVLHRVEETAAVLSCVVETHEVGGLDGGEDPELPRCAAQRVLVRGAGEHLHCDEIDVQSESRRGVRHKELPVRARTKPSDELVVRDRLGSDRSPEVHGHEVSGPCRFVHSPIHVDRAERSRS